MRDTTAPHATAPDATSGPILQGQDIGVTFKSRRAGRAALIHAVRGISLSLDRKETLGIVGESGSGKSTLARALMRLVPSTGTITLDGEEISQLSQRAFRSRRGKIQMVFQDPYSSLNPSMTVGDSIAEPLLVQGGYTAAQRHARVTEVLELVRLPAEVASRYPDEFSGGQRQRIAIARALISEPDILVCDEAVSALDISTQNQIIHLIEELQERVGVACLFISHDLSVVRHISDRVAVMYLGQVVEDGPVDRLFDAPAHPYTKILIDAVPLPDPVHQRARQRFLMQGDIPDPANPPPGCAFSSRCPMALDICRHTAPVMRDLGQGRGRAACHLHDHGPRLDGAGVGAAMAAKIQEEMRG